MSRRVRLSLVSPTMVVAAASTASAQEAACKPLYDATRKAGEQPGIERTVTHDGMRMVARKTADGWFSKIDDAPWRKMPYGPETGERAMLEDPGLFTKCVAGKTALVGGESARAWSYVTRVGPAPSAATVWISEATGLPIRVEGDGTAQVSVYRSTPFPKP